MERRVFWRAVLVIAALGLACGDDSGGGDDNNNNNEGGSGGGNTGTSGSGEMIPGEGIACGTTRCTMPEGSTVAPCCFDMFDSICGMMGGFTGMNCVGLVPPVEGCPTVSFGPFTIPNCCDSANMCGIEDPIFGGGCIELGEAERMAMERFGQGMMSDADGGMEGPGPMFMVDFPDPQACP